MILSARAPADVRDRIVSWHGRATAGPSGATIAKRIVAPALAALLSCGADARAEHECGPPEAGEDIVCSPANYDPSADGNIFYGPDEANQDIAITLSEGLSIDYDREAPGDDIYVPPENPGNPRYSAVWVTPGESGHGYTGAISLTSFANVTSNGRGISVGHYGESGTLRMAILGGSVATTGEDSWAIHSYRAGVGDTNVTVQNVPVSTDGASAIAIISGHLGEGELDIDVRDATLSTRGADADGVYGLHRGTGDLTMRFRDVDIATASTNAYGIVGIHTGEGRLDMSAEALAIDTAGLLGRGVYGLHLGSGDVGIQTRRSSVSTLGSASDGIAGIATDDGDLEVAVADTDIVTVGDEAEAVYAEHSGAGDARVDVQRTGVATGGAQAEGILAQHQGTGALAVILRDLDVTTGGHYAEGVFAAHAGTGGIDVDARNIAIATTGEGSDAMLAGVASEDDLSIRIREGVLSTGGLEARGIYGVHGGAGALSLDLRATAIVTAGERADGIAIEHRGTGSLGIAVDASSVRATGPDANGIRMGRLNDAGLVERAADVDEEGNRNQTVTLNGPVLGGSREGAGVFLAGGGSIIIGPRGSLGAASGLAVRVAGEAPRLLVDMQLDNRRIAQVIGDDVIHNPEGETTIRVNGVVLHAGASGATGLAARNGARNVTIVGGEAGAGRIFSHEDFREDYAPRAAVHEALPDFLLKLDAPGPAGARVASPGSPAWARLSGSRYSHEPDHASVGAEYAFDRYAAEAGLEVSLGENVAAFVSARRLWGSADVTSPTGGGEIGARSSGMAVGLAFEGPDAHYARGRLSIATYTLDLSSNTADRLATGIDARVDSLHLEAGRHVALNEHVQLTPRIRIARSEMEVDSFTDFAGSRISVGGVTRLAGSVGVVATTTTTLTAPGAVLSLRGSLDIARTFSGTNTTVDVAGEALESRLPGTRLHLALGGMFRRDRLSVEARVRVGGLASGNAEYAGQVGLGWSF